MWADADGDGDLDFIGAGRTEPYGILQPKVYRKDGDFLFTDTNPGSPSSNGGALRVADFDQDGDVDVLLNAAQEDSNTLYDPRVRIYFNDGNLQFTDGHVTLTDWNGSAAEVMDLEGDGDVDLIAAGAAFSTYDPVSWILFQNNRAPTGSVPEVPTNLVSEVLSNKALLRWSASLETTNPVTFALRVGTQPGACDIISPMVAPGGRRLAAGLGNAQASRRWKLSGLSPGTYYWSVQAVDYSYRGSAFAAESSFVVPEENPLPPAPTISELPHQFTDEDVPLPPVSFVIGPAESVSNLTVATEASNPTLAPPYGLVLSGEGTNRFLAITPGTNQSGTSLITVTVTDFVGRSASSSFLLTVHPVIDPPSIVPISNQIMYENGSTLTIPFFVTDVETNYWSLNRTVTSSNPDLFPASGLHVYQYSETNGEIQVTPQANRTGSAVITLTINDGLSEVSAGFLVTVLPEPFAPTSDQLANLDHRTIGCADFDSDGDLDLLLAGSPIRSSPDTVRYYRNLGKGRLQDSGLSFDGQFRQAIALVDYDRDDDVDAMLSSVNYSGDGRSSAQVLRNDEAGEFTVVSNGLGLIISILGSNPRTAWGDVDNDGDLDMAYSRPGETRILLNGDAKFNFSVLLPRVDGYVALGDYDGDAVLDVALSGESESGKTTNIVLHGIGNGRFTQSLISLDQSTYGRIGFADLNGDGLLDLWQLGFGVTNYIRLVQSMFLYRNLGSGQFGPPVVVSVGFLNSGKIRWADFDGDGDLDFMVESESPNSPKVPNYKLTIFQNDGDFQFSSMGDPLPDVEVDSIGLVSTDSLGIGDLDNDGDVDLIAKYKQTESIRLLTNRMSQLNLPPGAPTGLAAQVQGSSVWLAWRPAKDFNQSGALTYNVRVGTRPRRGNIVPAMSLTNGYRQVVDFGNAGVRTNAFLTNIVGETFYWSVQAVDNCYIGGQFAPEQTFVMNLPGNQPPEIGNIADQTTDEDTPLTLAFTVNDDRTPVENLRLRAYPANPFLLPATGVSFGGSGTNRTLTLSPATNQFGQTVVRLEATDAVGATTTRSLLLTVSNVNDAPLISPIPNQTNLYSETAVVEFGVQDSDTPADQLQFSATSSDPILVPTNNIMFSGSGSNRMVTLTPAVAREGQTLITITARDPEGAESSASFLLVLRNQVFRLVETPFGGVRQGSIAWGDYDNDGDLDLALAGQDLNEACIYQNDGHGVFRKVQTDLPNVDGGGIEWGDFDNDGDLDLLIQGRGKPGFIALVYRNDGAGHFDLVNAGLDGRYGPAAWGDFDNDGDLDIVSSGQYGAVIYENKGEGQFVLTDNSFGGGQFYPSAIDHLWEDLDQDGYLDLILMHNVFSYDSRSIWFRNNGYGHFAETNAPWAGSFLAQSDFDSDGLPDVLVSTGTRQSLRVLRRVGNASFVPWGTDIQTNLTPDSIAVGDFDNDGRIDVLSSGYESSFNYITRLFRNKGDGNWEQVPTPLPDFKFATAAWVDVDNDGDLDLLIDGQRDTAPLEGYSTLLYRNDQVRSNAPPSMPTGLRAYFTTNTVILSWQPATDAEQANGLTYNVRLGSGSGAIDVISPMSSSNGFRMVSQSGNAGWQTRKLVRGLQRGQTYYWSVQAVDNNHAGSTFAAEASFTVGEPPSMASISNQIMDEDGVLTVPLLITEPSIDVAIESVSAYAVNTGLVPEEGLTISGTETNRYLRIQPAPDQNGETTIEVTVFDAQGGMATRSFTLIVQSVNDAPRVQDLNFTMMEDMSQSFTLAAEDPDGDPLSFEMIFPPGSGELHGTAPSLTYVPETNFFGDDWCEFLVSDNQGASSSLRVSFNILPVADAPEPRIRVRMLSDGTPLLSLPSEPYQVYIIETSTNLVDWMFDGSYLTLGGQIEFFGESVPPGTARFYRARLLR